MLAPLVTFDIHNACLARQVAISFTHKWFKFSCLGLPDSTVMIIPQTSTGSQWFFDTYVKKNQMYCTSVVPKPFGRSPQLDLETHRHHNLSAIDMRRPTHACQQTLLTRLLNDGSISNLPSHCLSWSRKGRPDLGEETSDCTQEGKPRSELSIPAL